MIGIICLAWVGVQLNAPTWYYGLLIFAFILNLIDYGVRMYKKGAGKEEA